MGVCRIRFWHTSSHRWLTAGMAIIRAWASQKPNTTTSTSSGSERTVAGTAPAAFMAVPPPPLM